MDKDKDALKKIYDAAQESVLEAVLEGLEDMSQDNLRRLKKAINDKIKPLPDGHIPCPFCGSDAMEYEFAGSQGYIECSTCYASGPDDKRAADPDCDIDAAWDAWDRRINQTEKEAEPTDEQLFDVCLSYRHDFGLLNQKEQELVRFQAKEWRRAWQKTMEHGPSNASKALKKDKKP